MRTLNPSNLILMGIVCAFMLGGVFVPVKVFSETQNIEQQSAIEVKNFDSYASDYSFISETVSFAGYVLDSSFDFVGNVIFGLADNVGNIFNNFLSKNTQENEKDKVDNLNNTQLGATASSPTFFGYVGGAVKSVFSGIGNFFSSLFSGGDEKTIQVTPAPALPAVPVVEKIAEVPVVSTTTPDVVPFAPQKTEIPVAPTSPVVSEIYKTTVVHSGLTNEEINRTMSVFQKDILSQVTSQVAKATANFVTRDLLTKQSDALSGRSGGGGNVSDNVTSLSSLSTIGTIVSGVWNGSVLDILYGGTGETTATGALNALLPDQAGNNGKILGTDGSGGVNWITNASGAAWGTITGTLTDQADLRVVLNDKFGTTSTDYWKTQNNFFGTTSSAYWLTTKTTDDVAEGTNKYFSNALAQGAISVSGLPLTYSSGAVGINQADGSQAGYLSSADWLVFNNKFATTSTDYWKTQNNFFSTTSVDFWKTVNNFYSTTSADYWKTQNNFFGTTSTDFWKTQNNFHSTTSADHWLTTKTTDNISQGSTNLFSQWTTANGGINYASGNVGVGSTSPYFKLSVGGDSYLGGNLTATGTLTVQGTATSTFAKGIDIAEGCFAINGVCVGGSVGGGTWGSITGTLSDQTDLQLALDNKFATTSTDYWLTTKTIGIANGGTGETTAVGALNALLPSQTGNGGKVLSTDGSGTVSWVTNASGAAWGTINGTLSDQADLQLALNNKFATTSTDYWKTQNNFFSTTSVDFWKTVNNFYSTTSADYWKTQNNFFGTTSTDFWKTQNNFHSTTSADHWLTTKTTDNISQGSTNLFSQWTTATGGINYASGNVGIGNSTPTFKLHIIETENQAAARFERSDTTTNISSVQSNVSFVNPDTTAGNFVTFGFNTNSTGGSSMRGAGIGAQFTSRSATGVTADLIFQTKNGTDSIAEVMRIKATGKVGVGTTSPWKTLSVTGDMSLTGGFYDSLASVGTNGQVLQSTGSATNWVSTSTLGFIPYVGANADVNLGTQNLTTTGIGTFGVGRFTTGIKDNAGTPLLSVDTGNRKLYASDGTTVQLQYGTAGAISMGGASILATGSLFSGSGAGYQALFATYSNFLGSGAGFSATNAAYSNFLGNAAGTSATNASSSNFFGYFAGLGATNASSSNFFGEGAGFLATNASHSVFIGSYAGSSDTVNNSTGGTSIAIGRYSGTGGYSNSIALGRGVTNSASTQLNIGNVLYATGIYNSDTQSSAALATGRVGIGTSTPWAQLSVNPNGITGPAFAIGSSTATRFIVDNGGKVGVGTSSPFSNLSVVGDINATSKYYIDSLPVLSTNGNTNIFLGQSGSTTFSGGTDDLFAGYQAGYSNTSGSLNIFLGTSAGKANTTGGNNTFIGPSAGILSVGGSYNSFVGSNSGNSNISGGNNSFFGSYAGNNNNTGSSNNFFGDHSGTGNTSGFSNNFFGNYAGSVNSTGSYNTLIGDSADVSSSGLVNATAIGYNAIVGKSNSISLGATGASAVNVGIGTTSPYATLSVSSTKTATTTFALRPVSGQTANIIDIYDTSGTLNSVLTATGYLGIGTSTPWAQLSVNPNGITGPAFAIGSSTATRFIVDNGGKVGVGTSSPFTALSVVGNTYLDGTLTTSGAITSSGNITSANSFIAGNLNLSAGSFQHAASTGLKIFSGSSVSTANVVDLYTQTTFTNTSGTSTAFQINPIYNQSSGSASNVDFHILRNTTAVGSGNQYLALFQTGGSSVSFATSTRFVITAAGNVGISTTSPWASLSVVGTTSAQGIFMNNSNIESVANIFAYADSGGNVGEASTAFTAMHSYAFTQASDRNKKKNITEDDLGLNFISKLNPVSFDWKNEKILGRTYGFIAQDVEEVLGTDNTFSIVGHDVDGNNYTLDYTQFIAPIVSSVKTISGDILGISYDTSIQAYKSNRLDNIENKLNELSLEGAMGDIFEPLSITGSGSLVGTTTTKTLTQSFGQAILSYFETLGVKVVAGMAYLKDVFVERLTIGSREKPTGITMFDEVTGEPYCLKIRNGQTQSVPGTCESQNTIPENTNLNQTTQTDSSGETNPVVINGVTITPTDNNLASTTTSLSTSTTSGIETTTVSLPDNSGDDSGSITTSTTSATTSDTAPVTPSESGADQGISEANPVEVVDSVTEDSQSQGAASVSDTNTTIVPPSPSTEPTPDEIIP